MPSSLPDASADSRSESGLGCGFLFLPGMVVPHLPQKFAVKGKGLWHCEQFITGSLVLLDVI
jgi:hypothetical protein